MTLRVRFMKAGTLISLQLTCMVIMAGTGFMIFRSAIATIMFVLAFAVFMLSSIYIEKNRKRLLRENSKDS